MLTREKSEKGTLKLNVKISGEDWRKAIDEAYEQNKHKYNIQGFRKGKAPKKVIEKTYGDTIFQEAAFEIALSREYGQFLEQNPDIEPADYPRSVINSLTDDGLDVTLEVTLMPEVKLGELNFNVKKDEVKVSDEDVEAELKRFTESQARFEESADAAKNGDFVDLDFEGSVDGEVFEGGTAKNYRLELGSHTFIDGFEDQLIGTKVGEEKLVNVTFPENYPAENLAGKKAVFKCNINKVEKKILPELTDKLVSFSTEFASIDEFKSDIKKKILASKDAAAERKLDNDLIEALVKGAELDLPKSMVEHEMHHMVEDFKAQLGYQGIKLEDYLNYFGKSMEDFEAEKLAEAEKALKSRLVLQKLIKDQNIQISHEQFHQKLHEMADSQNKTCQEVEKSLSDYEISYIQNDILMGQITTLLRSKNK